MKLGDYPTPNETKLYINGQWIDDAFRVDHEMSNPKVPIYGYHQRNFSQVADGKVIVSGNLMIHFRYPGYLMYAINDQLTQRELALVQAADLHHAKQAAVGGAAGFIQEPNIKAKKVGWTPDDVAKEISEFRSQTLEERVRTLMDAHQDGTFKMRSALLEQVFTESVEDNAINYEIDPTNLSPNAYLDNSGGVDLDVYYGFIGSGNDGFYIHQLIRGVHFTGTRKVISASTGDGDMGSSGQSILEVYSFFARKVEYDLSRYRLIDRAMVRLSST